MPLPTIGTIILVTVCYIIPIATSILLIVLNLRGFYIGGELSGASGMDEWKLYGLHVATVAFCVTITLSFWDMLCRLTDTMDSETNHLTETDEQSLLFTKHPSDNLNSKYRNAITMVVGIGVFLLVRPSKVVIPDLRDWNAGGTQFWINSTFEDLWPSRLDQQLENDQSCLAVSNPHCFPSNIDLMGQLLSYWPHVNNTRKVMPEKINILGKGALRELEVRYRGPFDYQPPLTCATTPSAQIADALSELSTYWAEANRRNCVENKINFRYYNDIEYYVSALQPAVFTKCASKLAEDGLRFPKLDSVVGNSLLVASDDVILDTSSRNTTSPVIRWVELPEHSFGLSSIGAYITLPSNEAFTCTIDARWAKSKSKVFYSNGPMVVSGSPLNWFTSGRYQKTSSGVPVWGQIKLTPAWAEDVCSTSRLNMSTFALLGNYVSANSNFTEVLAPVNALEAILALMLTEGLSRTRSTAKIQGSLKTAEKGDWMSEMLPKRRAFGNGGEAYDYSRETHDQDTNLQMRTIVTGYGYDRTLSRLPAIAVISLYLLLISVFLISTIWRFSM